jgi:hypothetical protein
VKVRLVAASSRSVRLLRVLARSPEQDGLTLIECLGALGEGGRHAKAATVTMLKTLRDAGRVDYAAPPAGARRLGGVYRISAKGRAWLAATGWDCPAVDAPAAPQIQVVLETGAMRGERPTIIRTSAQSGQCPPGAPNWVFGLADACCRG